MLGININQYSDRNAPHKERKNLFLSKALILEAQFMGVNLSKAAETGIQVAIDRQKLKLSRTDLASSPFDYSNEKSTKV